MLAVIPVNAPERAKGRLAELLSQAERVELVHAMLADVVAACRATPAISDVLVVTPDPRIAPAGCLTLRDAGRGHTAALTEALATGEAAAGALIVMADCPLAPPTILQALADAAHPIALAPAQDGGTNAAALRPPDAVEVAFGVRDGARLTVERARARGFEPVVIDEPLLALDVDGPDDVELVLALGAHTRTAELLVRIRRASGGGPRRSAGAARPA